MKICWGLSSSYCTIGKVLPVLEKISMKNEVFALCSDNFNNTDTRFGDAKDHIKKITDITGRPIIDTIKDAEPIGPVLHPDIMVIAPCTGNTLAKLACGIFDTPLTLGAKAHLRNSAPLLIALATNDGLSCNFKNLAELYNRKNIYFVPLFQDDPVKKPHSLVCDFDLIPDAIDAAMQGKQLLPLFKSLS